MSRSRLLLVHAPRRRLHKRLILCSRHYIRLRPPRFTSIWQTRWRQSRATRAKANRLPAVAPGASMSPIKFYNCAVWMVGPRRRRHTSEVLIRACGARFLSLEMPTAPSQRPLPNATLAPFAMSGPSQFRPGPPYAATLAEALASAQYAEDLNEVKAIGRVDSAIRTWTRPNSRGFGKP